VRHEGAVSGVDTVLVTLPARVRQRATGALVTKPLRDELAEHERILGVAFVVFPIPAISSSRSIGRSASASRSCRVSLGMARAMSERGRPKGPPEFDCVAMSRLANLGG
jgi:hypothetical protein